LGICVWDVLYGMIVTFLFFSTIIYIYIYTMKLGSFFFLFPTLLYNGHVIYCTKILVEFFLYLDHIKLSPLHTQYNQLQHHISPTIMDLIPHQSQCSSTLLNKFIFTIYILNMNRNYFFKVIRHTISKK
jgi:hypothetical protein